MSKQVIETYIDEATGEKRVASHVLARMIELGREGKTRAVFASEFGVAKSTLDYWRQRYPEFSEAYDVAITAAQAWWEERGRDHLVTTTGQTFNSTVWARFLASHFKDDWMERKEVTQRDGDRGDLTTKTDEELANEIAQIEAQRAARDAARAEAAAARERVKARSGA